MENVDDHRLTQVTMDNFNGAKVMTQHLISTGHRRIGFVHNADDSIAAHDILRGYKAAVVEAGLPSEESLIGRIVHDIGYFNRETVDDMFARYLEAAGRPTAVFAITDMLAIKVLQACHNLGLGVPEDVAVAGYSDIMMSEHSVPPLTTMHEPGVEMGERAAEILFRRIAGTLKHHVHESIMGSLIIRKSCGAGVLSPHMLSCLYRNVRRFTAMISSARVFIVTLIIALLFPVVAWGDLQDLKSAQPGSPVNISSVIVSSLYYDDNGNPTSFAVENADRSNGMRVISSATVNLGDSVTIAGTTNIINSEPVIQATSVTTNTSGNSLPSPLGMVSLVSGGVGADLLNPLVNSSSSGEVSAGLNNMGVLIELFGTVTGSVDTGDYSGYFYIDDGSGLADGSGYTGIRCRPGAYSSYGTDAAPLPVAGDYVTVTGIMGAQSLEGVNSRYFWTQSYSEVSPVTASGPVTWRYLQFGSSTDVWGYSHAFTQDTSVADPAGASDCSIDSSGTSTCVTVTTANKTWSGYADVGTIGQFQNQTTFYGGEVILVTYSFSAANGNKSNISLQYGNGTQIVMIEGKSLINDGQSHVLSYTMPSSSVGQTLSYIWLNVENSSPGSTEMCLIDFTLQRSPSINTTIDADSILATPPAHDAEVANVNGAMAITVDGAPISAMGWSGYINANRSSQEIADMVDSTGFMCARLNFPLGEECYIRPSQYAPTWLGPNLFDWSSLDTQINRLLSANPQTLVILEVDLDGAIWWTNTYPQSAGVEASIGIPDYLSPEWERDSRNAIRQMVAHVQTSSYASAVIGYELFNGATFDCNFEVDDSTPSAIARFQAWLTNKYGTDAALQAAWGDSTVTLATAVPNEFFDANNVYNRYTDLWSFFSQPGLRPSYYDSAAFRDHVYQQVIMDFAHNIKEATQGRAIVGARTGAFMGDQTYVWDWGYPDVYYVDELINCADFDFFEVQETYYGRTVDGMTGSGVPQTIPQGLAAHNKLVVIQNDWRSWTGPDFGFGGTRLMETLLHCSRVSRQRTAYLQTASYSV